MKKKIPVILSVDTGVDDAVAILMSLASKNLEIKLIVCGHGNASLEHFENNTIGVLELASAPQIPVILGTLPSEKRQTQIHNAHGTNGLSGVILETGNRKFSMRPAENEIFRIAQETENLHFINLGPSTTLASTITKFPEIKNKLKKIIFMGGSIEERLDTQKPYSEYNVASDPESAEIIFKSGIDILMVPTEIGRKAFLDYFDIFKTKTTNHTGEVLEKIYRNYKHRALKFGVATCDSATIFSIDCPEIFHIQPVHGFVKYFDNIGTGVCLFDFENTPNMNVVTDVDIKKFKKHYFKLLSKLP
ncbi:MAG: nucleoside hydrolase [Clostridia bacterium]|nr:nucleoside hydrolase [Clostridia bacterium]